MVRLPNTILSLLPLLAVATSQSILPSSLPSCATTCGPLQTAQQSCEANPAAETSCFCQSAFLTTVKTTPSDNICAPGCSDADWATIQTWYAQLCANGGAATTSPASAAAAPAPTTMVTSASVTSSGSGPQPSIQEATPPSSGTSSSSGGSDGIASSDQDINDTQTGTQWWDDHYQWIIMLIVLLLFFTVAGFGGAWWYKRRQREKSRNMGAFAGGNAQQWAPNSSTHDFNAVADRQARGALAAQGGSFGGAAMVERANSRRKGKGVAGTLLKVKRGGAN